MFLFFRNAFWGALRVMWTSQVVQLVKNLLAMQETWVGSLGPKQPLATQGLATHSSILAWEIPWTEEPGGLQSWGPKIRQDLVTAPPPQRGTSWCLEPVLWRGRTVEHHVWNRLGHAGPGRKSCTHTHRPLTYHTRQTIARTVWREAAIK